MNPPRARQAGDRGERGGAILDAAERLLSARPRRLASMADVADEAGVAKGTVYLYFASQQELLLALHERCVETFFSELAARAEKERPMTVADVHALALTHLVAPPLCLPLAAHCLSASSRDSESDAAQPFRERMQARFASAGSGLERHFPQLAGGGEALLRHTFALLAGLWQLSAEGPLAKSAGATPPGRDATPAGDGAADMAADMERALSALWAGTLGPRAAPASR